MRAFVINSGTVHCEKSVLVTNFSGFFSGFLLGFWPENLGLGDHPEQISGRVVDSRADFDDFDSLGIFCVCHVFSEEMDL